MRAQALLALLVLMPQGHLLSSVRILKRARKQRAAIVATVNASNKILIEQNGTHDELALAEPFAADLGKEPCGNCGGKDELQGEIAKEACQICMKVQHEREEPSSKDAKAAQVVAHVKPPDAGAALAQVHRLSSGDASRFDGLWIHQQGPQEWELLKIRIFSILDDNGNGKNDFRFPGGDKIIFANVSGVLSHGKILWANEAVWVKRTASVSMQDAAGRWHIYDPEKKTTMSPTFRIKVRGDSATLSTKENITMVRGRPAIDVDFTSLVLFHVSHSKDELVWMGEFMGLPVPQTWRSWAFGMSPVLALSIGAISSLISRF